MPAETLRNNEDPAKVIERAIEVFVRGFTFTRSLAHPYLFQRLGPLWVMRDGPRRNSDYRVEEWVAHGVMPVEVDKIVQRHARRRFAICAICPIEEYDQPLRQQYKALGYKLTATEALMVHDLGRIPRANASAKVERITSVERAELLARASRTRTLSPEFFDHSASLRQYVAIIASDIIGWVGSVTTAQGTWCAEMYVKGEFRRQGIGRAMLCGLLRDDRSHGSQGSVLLASHTGAKLYASVGYRQIGTLLLMRPPRHY